MLKSLNDNLKMSTFICAFMHICTFCILEK
jgi:hypothetical protein